MGTAPEQIEIQLGHLCNNRCVFCVSGQMSERRMAGQIPEEPVIAELRRAHDAGIRRVTFLGGEPTIQQNFIPAITAAKELGFTEIILFTNGVQTAREEFIDEVLAIGDFTWRFSIQGGTRQHHDAVTRNSGSFDKLHRGIRQLKARGQRVTANMCITTENLASLPRYPELVAETGVEELHLDMIRPRDAGDRSEDYLRDIMPRYSDMREPLREMLEGFPDTFDVHVGNYPHCLLPEWSHRIHHDGVATWTVSADGRNRLDGGWDKYSTKREDKNHPEACGECVFRPQCNGLFETYQDKFGVDELRPVRTEDLTGIHLQGRAFVTIHGPTIAALEHATLPPTWEALEVLPDERNGRIRVRVIPAGDQSPAILSFAPDRTPGVLRVGEGWGLEIPSSVARDSGATHSLVEALLGHLNVSSGMSREDWDATGTRVRMLLPYAARMHAHAEASGCVSQVVPTAEGVQVEVTHPTLGIFRFMLEPPGPSKRTPKVGYSLSARAPDDAHRSVVQKMLTILKGAARKGAALHA